MCMIREKSLHRLLQKEHLECVHFCKREKRNKNNMYHDKLAQLEYLRELVAHAVDGNQKTQQCLLKSESDLI